MNNLIKTRILAGFAYAQVEAHESSVRFGFWEKRRSNEELAALLHREVSRIMEITIAGDSKSDHLADCSKLEEAIADLVIRCFDFSGNKKLSIAPAVLAKLEFNEKLSKICKKDF